VFLIDKIGPKREASGIMTEPHPVRTVADLPEKVGVLLVNLGTPDTADAKGVRVYLKEFLSDARVIENQGLLWKLVLNGIILNTRPRKKAKDYLKIWNMEKNESPLKTITRAQPTLRVTPPYYDEPDYIDALAISIDKHLATLDFVPEMIVASFHGMPQKYIDKGDPYQAQCVATTEALRKRMGPNAPKLLLTFQSRFGFDAWLQPYTDKTIEQLGKDGVKRLAVVMPGFSADCLETLEEIAQENCEIFLHNGGEKFSAIPCLNDSDEGMDVIRQLVLRELQGWI
jgi:protoheme ferro-lyase